MKIFITGGAGFVGSHLVDRFLARGDRVLVLDNYATGSPDNLTKQVDLAVIEGSVADEGLVENVTSVFRPDVVIHAAASYKNPEAWEEDARTNVSGTVNVVRAAKQYGAKRLIYLQTSLCYGLRPGQQPIPLTHPILPGGSSYAISKTAGELYVMLSGMDWQSFRLANAYGPRNLTGPLPVFFQRLTEGKACFAADTRRDFIYIDDMVDVLEKAVDGVGFSGVYHISTGTDCAIQDLFYATVEALEIDPERPLEIRARGADDAPTLLLDPSKTCADFDWTSRTPLEEGVKRTVEWYKVHGVTQTFTHLRAE